MGNSRLLVGRYSVMDLLSKHLIYGSLSLLLVTLFYPIRLLQLLSFLLLLISYYRLF